MAVKTVFICQNCGSQRSKWEGRCTDCGEWNTFQEETTSKTPSKQQEWGLDQGSDEVIRSSHILKKTNIACLPSGSTELDRSLGGGVVPGSLVLLGGDPGIGKSTLLLQMAGRYSANQQKVLYISAEESIQQSALRAQRLGIFEELLEIGSQSNLDHIIQLVDKTKPFCLIIDSIQTVFAPQVLSAPGTVSQVRECATRLMALAKNKNIATFLVGHVTKEGELAGPKVLEHIVDTVLSFEGDTHYQYRLLRTLKNRFGSTYELGVFEMTSSGLKDVPNPSEMFLQGHVNSSIGSAVTASLEGSRPVLCEVQALSVRSYATLPRRTCLGVDPNRLFLILAVLDKFMRYDFSRKDVFVNVVGGLKIKETAIDLSICAALLSSERNKTLPLKACFFGELGLTGEIRSVPFLDIRLKEGQKLGFKEFFIPQSREHSIKNIADGVNVHQIGHLSQLKDLLYVHTQDQLKERRQNGFSSTAS